MKEYVLFVAEKPGESIQKSPNPENRTVELTIWFIAKSQMHR